MRVSFKLAALSALLLGASAYPASVAQIEERQAGTPFWMESIKHQGISAFGASGYQVFRNVKDFGAKGIVATHVTESKLNPADVRFLQAMAQLMIHMPFSSQCPPVAAVEWGAAQLPQHSPQLFTSQLALTR